MSCDSQKEVKQVEIVLSEDAVFSETRDLLIKAGFNIGTSFDELHLIYGSIELEKISDLESIPAVVSVREEGMMKSY